MSIPVFCRGILIGAMSPIVVPPKTPTLEIAVFRQVFSARAPKDTDMPDPPDIGIIKLSIVDQDARGVPMELHVYDGDLRDLKMVNGFTPKDSALSLFNPPRGP